MHSPHTAPLILTLTLDEASQSFFDDLRRQLTARADTEAAIAAGLADGEMRLQYQPVHDVARGVVTGFEALVRWHRPGAGPVPPDQFIPVAEATGLIDALGAYVLERACADAMTWPGSLRVAVNISPIQFREGNLDRFVEEVLMDTLKAAAVIVGANFRFGQRASGDVALLRQIGIDNEFIVEGIDQQVVGQVAANIREWRKPEPYKGKGIKYKGEFIFRKEGKKK